MVVVVVVVSPGCPAGRAHLCPCRCLGERATNAVTLATPRPPTDRPPARRPAPARCAHARCGPATAALRNTEINDAAADDDDDDDAMSRQNR